MEIIVPKHVSDWLYHVDKHAQFPFYHLIPKDKDKQLQYRQDLLTKHSRSRADRTQLFEMCRRDLLFYVNAFCWTYDPRLVDVGNDDPIVPFNTYPFQDYIFSELESAIGKRDLVMRKSRDMGASWMCLTVFEWRFHFAKRRESYMMISRIGDLVDKGEDPDPDTLFWKLDFILENQPRWLKPPIKRREMQFKNADTGSIITGARTTGEAGRGGRRTGFFIDEHNAFQLKDGYAVLAATRDNTNCRIVNGTAKGVGTAFHSICTKGKWNCLEMWWHHHPIKGANLYKDEDGNLRSPWYDGECDRAANKEEIAAELDGNFSAAEYQFYGQSLIEQKKLETALPPYLVGTLAFDPRTMEPKGFRHDDRGHLRLWCHLDAVGFPTQYKRYVLSADTSQGTGASNSCIVILDGETGEQVGEYANSEIDPKDFGKLGLALAYWFGGGKYQHTFIIWEANGPGRSFGRVITDSGYRNIYYRQQEDKLTRDPTDFPGWWANNKTRKPLHEEFQEALKEGRVTIRSLELLNELSGYKHINGDDVVHVEAENTLDPTGARASHGDRGLAGALAVRGLGHISKESVEAVPKLVPPGCFEYRRRKYYEKLKQKALW